MIQRIILLLALLLILPAQSVELTGGVSFNVEKGPAIYGFEFARGSLPFRVLKVFKGTPAGRSGLLEEDLVTSYSGKLPESFSTGSPGDVLILTIKRPSTGKVFKVILVRESLSHFPQLRRIYQ